ncbi:MAG: UDP-N-acetylglucosamine 2-epimerase (non-hydrolyzing) [Casimicrobiaceae bacterium]
MRDDPSPSRGGAVLCVVGARPNFMKMAPILRAFAAHVPHIPALLVHTGQHYDAVMSDRLFADLQLPEPDINLAVGSGSHAVQTAEVMQRFEPLIDAHAPTSVLVVGDVNSTLACSLVAVKRGVPVVHVEAGLRSFDRTMPEEINRVLTDQISDVLYTSERGAEMNLLREGIAAERIRFVGNVMIDSLLANRRFAVAPAEALGRAGFDGALANGPFGVVTMHRPANVDDPRVLRTLLEVLGDIGTRLPILFPVHPRTRSAIENLGGLPARAQHVVTMLPPLGYLEMLGLLAEAKLVLTDSGGIQEEATALGVPCLTLRDNTERPITVSEGTNTLVGRDPGAIARGVDEILANGGKGGRIPEGWDGKAAERIAVDLATFLASPQPTGAHK